MVVSGVLVWGPWKEGPRQRTPKIELSADPAAIQRGDSATLSWNAENADEVRLEPSPGTVEVQGSLRVSPQSDIWYKLIARGSGGTIEDSVRVTVTGPTPAPTANLSVQPATLKRGNSTTLSWTTTKFLNHR